MRGTLKGMKNAYRFALVSVLLLALGAVAEGGIEFTFAGDPKWQGRIIVWILFAQTGGIVLLCIRFWKTWKELQSQHKASTYVATVEGLLNTLAIGAEHGGLPLQVREQIYLACQEQFRWYHETMSEDNHKQMVIFETPREAGLDSDAPATAALA
jgi:hypothetical protein